MDRSSVGRNGCNGTKRAATKTSELGHDAERPSEELETSAALRTT